MSGGALLGRTTVSYNIIQTDMTTLVHIENIIETKDSTLGDQETDTFLGETEPLTNCAWNFVVFVYH